MKYELRVNPITCDGHGMCAELLPEIIRLDRWGYPILMTPNVPRKLADHARRAVESCPTLALLLEEMKGENRLRRVLGPVRLTSLGVGAIIGTGIFVLTGKAAHDNAGPALILSFVVSGIACVFAALCYAEFASMVPVASRTVWILAGTSSRNSIQLMSVISRVEGWANSGSFTHGHAGGLTAYNAERPSGL